MEKSYEHENAVQKSNTDSGQREELPEQERMVFLFIREGINPGTLIGPRTIHSEQREGRQRPWLQKQGQYVVMGRHWDGLF